MLRTILGKGVPVLNKTEEERLHKVPSGRPHPASPHPAAMSARERLPGFPAAGFGWRRKNRRVGHFAGAHNVSRAPSKPAPTGDVLPSTGTGLARLHPEQV